MMRSVLLLAVFNLLFLHSFGQNLIVNGGFENFKDNCNTNQISCLAGYAWSGGGSISVKNNSHFLRINNGGPIQHQDPGTLYSGNGQLIKGGVEYTIRFNAVLEGPFPSADLRFHYGNNGLESIPVPVDSSIVEYTFVASENANSFSLGIQILGTLYIDNLELVGNFAELCCSEISKVYNNVQNNVFTNTVVSTTIEALNNTYIDAGQLAIFDAGQGIKLKAGFRAKAGSSFLAKIGGCTPNASTMQAMNLAGEDIYFNPLEIDIETYNFLLGKDPLPNTTYEWTYCQSHTNWEAYFNSPKNIIDRSIGWKYHSGVYHPLSNYSEMCKKFYHQSYVSWTQRPDNNAYFSGINKANPRVLLSMNALYAQHPYDNYQYGDTYGGCPVGEGYYYDLEVSNHCGAITDRINIASTMSLTELDDILNECRYNSSKEGVIMYEQVSTHQIYPNPFSALLMVKVNSAEVKIYDLMGVEIYSGKPGLIDMAQQTEGMYIVKWEENGEVKTEKVVLAN